MVLMAGGFAYTAVLFMSLYEHPESGKLVAAFLILGISNLFVFYASAIVMFLPEEIAGHFILRISESGGGCNYFTSSK